METRSISIKAHRMDLYQWAKKQTVTLEYPNLSETIGKALEEYADKHDPGWKDKPAQ